MSAKFHSTILSKFPAKGEPGDIWWACDLPRAYIVLGSGDIIPIDGLLSGAGTQGPAGPAGPAGSGTQTIVSLNDESPATQSVEAFEGLLVLTHSHNNQISVALRTPTSDLNGKIITIMAFNSFGFPGDVVAVASDDFNSGHPRFFPNPLSSGDNSGQPHYSVNFGAQVYNAIQLMMYNGDYYAVGYQGAVSFSNYSV
jgi:hypothetical protein